MKLPPGVTIKGGRYYRVQSLPNRKQKWHKLTRVSEGIPALYTALAALEAMGTTSGLAIPSRIAAWLRYALPGLSASEQKETARMADIVSTAFADFHTPQVRAAHILEFLDTNFVRPGKQRTAQRYRALLMKFFKWVILQGDRQDNPVDPVTVKAPPIRDRYITHTEYLAIREALLIGVDGKATASGPVMQCFIDLCYLTGQRSTEIRAMRWSQVDEDEGVIRFKPSKTARSTGAKIHIPITQSIDQVLQRAKATNSNPAYDFVIQTGKGGSYTTSGVQSAWERACKRARVENATIKDLRAKHATDAERAGYAVEEIQQALAHGDSSTTRGYLKQKIAKTSRIELSLPCLEGNRNLRKTGQSRNG